MFGNQFDLITVKSMFKKLYILLILGSALACKAAPGRPAIKLPGSNDLHPDEQQSVVCKTSCRTDIRLQLQKG
jgi:carboxyl-terminal processing protease